MAAGTHTAIVQQYLNAWSRNDITTMMSLLHNDCITHNLATGKELGIDFEREACELWHASFSDSTLTIEKLVTGDDTVAVYWSLTGTHTGEFVGIAPTGKQVKVPGMEMNRVQEGKIIEIWRLSDTMSLMQQLGGV